jgi:hypothetical protein
MRRSWNRHDLSVGAISGDYGIEMVMSALCQKQTFAPQKVMSALIPKADMCDATRDVPLRANSGHFAAQTSCPLYSQKRTFDGARRKAMLSWWRSQTSI